MRKSAWASLMTARGLLLHDLGCYCTRWPGPSYFAAELLCYKALAAVSYKGNKAKVHRRTLLQCASAAWKHALHCLFQTPHCVAESKSTRP